MIQIVEIAVSLIPVLAFLAALLVLDSFKLVPTRSVLLAIGFGVLAAAVAFVINGWLLGSAGVSANTLRRYVAPVVEELLKCLYLIYLIRSHRVGFLVDTAIYGFAIGTGFALVENIYYLRALGDASLFVWIVRGFGTAILHGSTMAIFGMLSKNLTERHDSAAVYYFLPGLGIAIVIHGVFNHVPLNPLAMAAILIVVMPMLVILVFAKSEAATRRWLGVGFDTDLELLELIMSGEIRESGIGRYLNSLKTRFPGTVLADMLCLLQIHAELSIRAKTQLIAREAGVKLQVDEADRANLKELKFLERSVGKTGWLAISPILHRSRRDLWQLYMLGKST